MQMEENSTISYRAMVKLVYYDEGNFHASSDGV